MDSVRAALDGTSGGECGVNLQLQYGVYGSAASEEERRSDWLPCSYLRPEAMESTRHSTSWSSVPLGTSSLS